MPVYRLPPPTSARQARARAVKERFVRDMHARAMLNLGNRFRYAASGRNLCPDFPFCLKGSLWGEKGSIQFFEAKRRGCVEQNELRAMELMRKLCDEERFLIYTTYGQIPARGNLTGKIYLIRRRRTVLEFDNGKPVAVLCVHIDTRFPQTDNTVVLKNLIEGEEGHFLKTANRSIVYRLDRITDLPPIPHLAGI